MPTLAPPASVVPILSDAPATGTIAWRSRAVAALDAGDLAAIEAILGDHAAASAIERRERATNDRAGRAWTPVVVDAGGSRLPSGGDAAAALAQGAPWVRLRTFGHSATVTFGRFGLAVRVDDDPALARRTLGRIRRLVRPRRDPVAACLEAAWTVPVVVLGLPVVSSLLDGDGHAGRATWEGMSVAVAILVASLWWRHRFWLERPLSPTPGALRAGAPSISASPSGDGIVPGASRS